MNSKHDNDTAEGTTTPPRSRVFDTGEKLPPQQGADESITNPVPTGFPPEFTVDDGPCSALVARAAFRWAVDNAPGLLRRNVRAVENDPGIDGPTDFDARARFASDLGAYARRALGVAADETRTMLDAAARALPRDGGGTLAESFAWAQQRAAEAFTFARLLSVAVAWERVELAPELHGNTASADAAE